MATVDIADTDLQLNKLVEQAESGETIDILGHGKLVAQIRATAAPKKPVDLRLLQSVTCNTGARAKCSGVNPKPQGQRPLLMFYLDTSVMVAALVTEVDTLRAQAWITARSDKDLAQ